jgi:hypothetical protein
VVVQLQVAGQKPSTTSTTTDSPAQHNNKPKKINARHVNLNSDGSKSSVTACRLASNAGIFVNVLGATGASESNVYVTPFDRKYRRSFSSICEPTPLDIAIAFGLEGGKQEHTLATLADGSTRDMGSKGQVSCCCLYLVLPMVLLIAVGTRPIRAPL